MTERIAGLRGRKPQRPEGERFAIRWLHEYAPVAPAPRYPIDVSQGITDWGMLGNDTYGDCGPCGYAHERMLAGAKPTAAEVVKLYLTYDHGQDEGVVIADFLLWLFHQNLIQGFAPVELSTVDAVMAQFGRGVLLGVNLTDDANDRFNQNLPWTVRNGEQPDPNEGHVILKVGAQSIFGDGTAVTWGANQIIENSWETACIEEAWVIVTKDDIGTAAYNALLADLIELPHATTVTPPPAPAPAPVPAPQPVPTPTPAPVPNPGPTPDVSGVIAQLKKILHKAEAEMRAVIHAFVDKLEGN